MANQSTIINQSLSLLPQAVAPSSPVEGEIYLDAATNLLLQYSSGVWRPVSSAAGYYSGHHDSVYSWSTTSLTTTDFTPLSVGFFLERSSFMMNDVYTAGLGLPGITFTPASAAAVYLVQVNLNAYADTTSNVVMLFLTDGTSVIAEAESQNANPAVNMTVPMTGIYIATSASPVTLKLQGKVTGGTGYIGGGYTSSIEWTLLRIG